MSEIERPGDDWAAEIAKDIRLKWMQSAFLKGHDFALPAGHLSDIAAALRHAEATGYTRGRAVVSTPSPALRSGGDR